MNDECYSLCENISIQTCEVSVYHQKRTTLWKKDRSLLLYWILKTRDYRLRCQDWNNTMTRFAFISSQHCESDLVFSISDSSEHVSIFFLQSMFAFSWRFRTTRNWRLYLILICSHCLQLSFHVVFLVLTVSSLFTVLPRRNCENKEQMSSRQETDYNDLLREKQRREDGYSIILN